MPRNKVAPETHQELIFSTVGSPMNSSIVPRLVFILALVGVGLIVLNWLQREVHVPPAPAGTGRAATPAPPAEVVVEPPRLVAQPEAKIHYPIEAAGGAEDRPLPQLGESDATMREFLAGVFDRKLAQMFYPDAIVRRLVATIDNLPREEAALRLMPVKPARGLFDTTGDRDERVISAENYRRYAPIVRLVESVDSKKLVGEYVHFYPLFQRQYQELGYPNGYFNDRLVEVIDHLLAAPEVRGPVKLTRPRILWKFADPKLESLSAGQKAMIRMGGDNEARVKAKLREIRQELTGPRGQTATAVEPAPAVKP